MTKTRAAIFASGTGSNFLAIMAAKDLSCEIACLVCDQPEAPVIKKAQSLNIQTIIISPKAFSTKIDYEKEIVIRLKQANITWLFLAGYMRLIGDTLLQPFSGKIINIHPSLLPDFPGLDAIGQALTAGVSKTGVTVHYVDAGMDTGPIIAQEEVEIFPEDTKEILQKRIQAVEHTLYPAVIKQLMNDTY